MIFTLFFLQPLFTFIIIWHIISYLKRNHYRYEIVFFRDNYDNYFQGRLLSSNCRRQRKKEDQWIRSGINSLLVSGSILQSFPGSILQIFPAVPPGCYQRQVVKNNGRQIYLLDFASLRPGQNEDH